MNYRKKIRKYERAISIAMIYASLFIELNQVYRINVRVNMKRYYRHFVT